MAKTVELKPIAYFHCSKKNPYEAARQATADLSTETGEIHFLESSNFEQALDGIEGFSHLWVIFQFHLNSHWKAKVSPPRGSSQKMGVFATRSPHRPNSLGLSCVRLIERRGLILAVQNFDLLDQSPIFDIKPYLTYADSMPEARLGWLENIEAERFEVSFCALAREQISFLGKLGLTEIENFLHQQLSYEPMNRQKKRLEVISESQAILAYRTWRVSFSITQKEVTILNLFSGYSPEEIQSHEDPYHDKSLHREFRAQFSNR